jgi:hypothetical protein
MLWTLPPLSLSIKGKHSVVEEENYFPHRCFLSGVQGFAWGVWRSAQIHQPLDSTQFEKQPIEGDWKL